METVSRAVAGYRRSDFAETEVVMRAIGAALALLYGGATIAATLSRRLSTAHTAVAMSAGALLVVGGVLALLDVGAGAAVVAVGAVDAIAAAVMAGYALHGRPQPRHV